MNDNSDNTLDNSDNNSEYLESNDDKGRNQRKYRDFDNFNNKNSIRAFLSSILEKYPNFSLKSQSPEEILKIYKCYLSGENFTLENDFSTNNSAQNYQESQSMDTESNEDSSTIDENSQDDHFSLKKQNNKLNILTDIRNVNQADAREFIFSYFELINSPLLSTQAFSMMVIDGFLYENDVYEKDSDDYNDYDDDDDDFHQHHDEDQDQDQSQSAEVNINSLLLNKFLKNTGSLEVFVDHYATIVNPLEAKTCKTNKEFIESRILQFKSVTSILTSYPSLISRMSKIIKKFAPILFSLIKQSDISTSIEAFRCIVSIFNNKLNIIKKKTRRKWLVKLLTFCSPDSPLLTLISNFILNQNMIKFEFPSIADRLIERSILIANKKKNNNSNKDKIDDYKDCSQLALSDDCFEGACNMEVLSVIESILIKVSQLRNKKLKKTKITKNDELNNDNYDPDSTEQKQISSIISDINNSDDLSAHDLQNSITFLFNVAIEDTIFGRYAIEIIHNILVAFTSPNDKKATKNSDDDDDDNNENSFSISGVLTWAVFLIRKSICMFSIAERSENFLLFEKRCRSIENLCYRICQQNSKEKTVSEYVISKTKNIIKTALICRESDDSDDTLKGNNDNKEGRASIVHLAKILNIDSTKSDTIDENVKDFMNSTISQCIDDSELTQFVHYPFDEKIDSALMDD